MEAFGVELDCPDGLDVRLEHGDALADLEAPEASRAVGRAGDAVVGVVVERERGDRA